MYFPLDGDKSYHEKDRGGMAVLPRTHTLFAGKTCSLYKLRVMDGKTSNNKRLIL